MNENLLEQTYIDLAQNTLSESQFRKLTNSEFEQVREIVVTATANIQSMNESQEITEQMILDSVNMKTSYEKLKFLELLVSQAQSITSHGGHSTISVNGMTIDFVLHPTISGDPDNRRVEDSRRVTIEYPNKRIPTCWYSLDLIYRVNGGDKMYVSLGKWGNGDGAQKAKVINNANRKVQFLKIETDDNSLYRSSNPGV